MTLSLFFLTNPLSQEEMPYTSLIVALYCNDLEAFVLGEEVAI